ncbi:hypothetical protein [Bosea sp. (in: a-proteobacteria)]|uniref:hypothetical protein n=1 Tax=Bosea sp. (in: a-proteobacteria) TaxID=1871050 RepID=UPI002616B19D|nr:hypothetical protein [Bosea sp. (in: a-proteobacteria)]MCO5090155.1 hypothetical protein [Bosea sp. (in: a-proteobacteria)]
MIVPRDRVLSDDGAAPAGERPFDGSTMGLDMAAHVTLERVLLPHGRPTLSVAAGRRFVEERTPALRSGLGFAMLLGLRFVQARLISVWGLIIAAALCPPFVFAAFAVFAAAANLVSVAALLRFEAVFFRNSDRARLGLAFRLAAAVGAAFLAVTALVLAGLVLGGWIAPAVAFFFLVSLTARSVLRLIWSEATAEGDFRAIGNSNVVQAVVQPGIMLLLIWLFGPKALALFVADALGHVLAATYLLRRRWGGVAGLVEPALWSWHSLVRAASRWRDAPSALLPSALLAYGFAAAPLLALPYASNTVLAAQVALSMRLLDMPTQMFGTVSTPLVLNGLRAHAGRHRRFWGRVVALGLIAAATVLFSLIACASTLADHWLIGTKWQDLGEVVALMAAFYIGIAVLAPLQEVATLSRRPFWQVSVNAAALAAIVAAMAWFGELSPALLQAIGAISILRALAHALFVWLHLDDRAEAAPDGLAAPVPAG